MFLLQGSTCFVLFSSSGELALTNFDTQRLEEITNRGIRISSNQVTPPSVTLHQTLAVPALFTAYSMSSAQVQYSLIDQRPAVKMEHFCLANNIQLLTYGTLGENQHFHSLC